MKKNMTSRQLQAIETKQRIQDNTMELFKMNDFEDVSIMDICTNAEVSVGSFYNYYASKEELIMECYHKFDEYVEEEFALIKFDTNVDAIKYLIYKQTSTAEDYGSKLFSQMLRVQVKTKGKYVIEETRPFHIHLKRLVKNALEEGEFITDYSADDISNMILRISRGTLYDWSMREVTYSVSEQALHFIDMFLKTIVSSQR